MKKLAVVILLSLAIGGLILIRTTSSSEKTGVATDSEPVAGDSAKKARSARPEKLQEDNSFLQNPLVANLRAAMAARDQALIEKAFEELVAFIQQHPELTEEYLAALRTEPEEHLLRGLAKAMQRSETLMENDAFIKSLIDLAQQQGFEQRQHIVLDTLAHAAYIKPDLFDAIKNISEAATQPSEVRASAIAVYADWMRKFPEKSPMMISELGRSLKETDDETVRALSVQLLALHRDKLTRDIQLALAERLKVEPQPAGQNLIASALSAAPPEIRGHVLGYLQGQYSSQADVAQKRLTLAQMVMLSPMEMRPMLEEVARGDSDLANDAREYLVLVNTQQVTPEMIMNSIVILAGNDPSHEHTEGCKH